MNIFDDVPTEFRDLGEIKTYCAYHGLSIKSLVLISGITVGNQAFQQQRWFD